MKRLINITDVENGLLNQENTLEVSSGIFYSEQFVNLPIHARYLYLIIANECDKRNTDELPIDDIDFKKRLECSKKQGIKYLKELEKINLVTYEDEIIRFIHKEIIDDLED